MEADTTEMQTLLRRVERLEVAHRRMRRGGAAVLGGISALVLVAQVAPRLAEARLQPEPCAGATQQQTPHIVEAQKFVVKDEQGNVRAWLGVLGKGSEVVLGNDDQQPRLTLVVGTDASSVHLAGSRKSGMTLGVDAGAPSLSLSGADGAGDARLAVGKLGPSLMLRDAGGFSASLGSVAPQNSAEGESRRTSAASLVLTDKEKKVLWRAP